VLTTLILLVTYVGVTCRDVLRGAGDTGMGSQRGQRDDVFFGAEGRAVRALGVAAGRRRHDLRDLVDADDDPADRRAARSRWRVYKALPRRFAPVHPRYSTPAFSTLRLGVRGHRVLRGLTLISAEHPADTVLIARPRDRVLLRHHGFAVRLVLPIRRSSRRGVHFWYQVAFPLVGALLLTGAFIYSAIDCSTQTTGTGAVRGRRRVRRGVGSLLLGAC
jgi:hypothetical protein